MRIDKPQPAPEQPSSIHEREDLDVIRLSDHREASEEIEHGTTVADAAEGKLADDHRMHRDDAVVEHPDECRLGRMQMVDPH